MCSLSITELSLTCKTSRVSCKHLFESCEVVHLRSRPPPWKEHGVGGYASSGTRLQRATRDFLTMDGRSEGFACLGTLNHDTDTPT